MSATDTATIRELNTDLAEWCSSPAFTVRCADCGERSAPIDMRLDCGRTIACPIATGPRTLVQELNDQGWTVHQRRPLCPACLIDETGD